HLGGTGGGALRGELVGVHRGGLGALGHVLLRLRLVELARLVPATCLVERLRPGVAEPGTQRSGAQRGTRARAGALVGDLCRAAGADRSLMRRVPHVVGEDRTGSTVAAAAGARVEVACAQLVDVHAVDIAADAGQVAALATAEAVHLRARAG